MTSAAQLEAHFREVSASRMRGLPICNPQLDVEAAGFEAFGDHQLGVMITPWFMNLTLLPGTDEWHELEQGATAEVELPAGAFEFTVSRDDALGSTLSASLFSTVTDFPDQATARETALEVLRLVREPSAKAAPTQRKLTRRSLLRGETAHA